MTGRRSREEGFTIIEVIVAVFVLVMAALATFGLLSSATKNTERAKATQVALDRAQQEIEALHGLSSEELAMTETPPYSSDALNPNHRVLNGTFALSREPLGSYATMVVHGGELEGGGTVPGGTVDPGPISFTSGDVSGKVYRYVVWRNDPKCSEEKCPGRQDYKQIVVAVKLNTPGNQAGERGYVEVQSDFVDPVKSVINDPVPGENGVVTAQQFFLTDTPCAAAGTTVRQEISGDHLLHDTLGTCASGLQEETTPGTVKPGAPDALLLGQPPTPEEGGEVPFYDYSSDEYLEPEPDVDHGVQILAEQKNGCTYKPEAGWTHPQAQVHRWVTDPMAAKYMLTGKVTIEFYTRTLVTKEDTHGMLCVYLFKRHEEPVGGEEVATDTALVNVSGNKSYWEFKPENNGWWPRLNWEKERLKMEFKEAPYTIPAGDRLGVALSVEADNTDATAIPIMYDHPSYPTRIEVDTSTPIEGG